jgi:adenylate cyclase class IV
MANIEIEHRALVTEEKYDQLLKFLGKNGQDLGEDDKDVFFFLVPNKICKVVDNVSQKTAKIVLKLNSLGNGNDFEEIEIPIAQSEVDKAVRVFEKLQVGEMMRSFQKRHNYMYKGVELAVKFSEHWRYHVELEVLVSDIKDKPAAEEKIKKVAEKLELKIMQDDELAKFTTKLENEYRKTHKK